MHYVYIGACEPRSRLFDKRVVRKVDPYVSPMVVG